MKPESGASLSIWAAKNEINKYPVLEADVKADICVVGGGISGLTAAYLLSKESRKVILVEDGNIASGESARTTAHVTDVIDDRFYEMEKTHGEENVKLIYDSETSAVRKIQQI